MSPATDTLTLEGEYCPYSSQLFPCPSRGNVDNGLKSGYCFWECDMGEGNMLAAVADPREQPVALELYKVTIFNATKTLYVEQPRRALALDTFHATLVGLDSFAPIFSFVSRFPPEAAESGATIQLMLRRCGASFVPAAPRAPPAAPPVAQTGLRPASVTALGNIDSYTTNDVLFLFPTPSSPPRHLWSNAALLSATSPYFRTMLSAGFAESSELYPALRDDKVFNIECAPAAEAEVEADGKGSAGSKRAADADANVHGPPGNRARREEDLEETLREMDFLDSDAEDDLPAAGPAASLQPVRRVIVRNTPYKTYRAVLFYLSTQQVAFAPLSSTRPAKTSSASPDTRREPPSHRLNSLSETFYAAKAASDIANERVSFAELRDQRAADFADLIGSDWVPAYGTSRHHTATLAASDPSLGAHSHLESTPASIPPTVSPKSLYRLADALELIELRALCLANFESQLTVANVVQELFSDFAACYDEIKEAAIEVALANWQEVAGSEAMLELEMKMAAGQLDGRMGAIAVALFKKLRPV